MKISYEGQNVEVSWSVNTPGLYYILSMDKISKEQFEELKFADALKKLFLFRRCSYYAGVE